jgi:WD40 repeat protein/transcriptional regulator with XRE-family HTH domain
MDASEETTPEGDRFRGRILLLRGRAGLTQRALAALLGVSEQAIKNWEAGRGYPSSARLQAVIALYLERGLFTAGREAQEATALWEALRREAAQRTPAFDDAWFARLRPAAPEDAAASSGAAGASTTAPEHSRWQAWGEAPAVAGFQGRQAEGTALRRWLVEERCRLVAVLGLGGIGKTALATHTARAVAPHFEALCWRSLRNGPPPEEWLGTAIGALAPTPPVLPPGLPARLGLLLEVLRERRCLLVLDNLETVLEPGVVGGRYRVGYEGYGEALQQVAESAHQSSLLLTGREAPPELALLAGAAPLRTLRLGGLDHAACRALLQGKGLVGDDDAWQGLVDRYGGNPLALGLVGQTIAELFGGVINALLAYVVETVGAMFGGMRRLLEDQVGRLSALEQSLLYWLAVEREPVGVVALRADLAPGAGAGPVLEALEALGRRSLLEQGVERATHTLQPVVLEYVTERLVEALVQEIMAGQPALLASHAVVQATGKDYVRRSQERLLAQPLLDRLVASCGGAAGAERRLVELVQGWRGRPQAEQGYGPGNVVNLLRLVRGDLRGLDLSHIAIRQAYLQGVEAQDASLAGAHLAEAVLAEAFGYATAVAMTADGAFMAAGMPTGEVRLWRVADRTLLLAAQVHNGAVWGVALAGDGRLLASGGADGTVRLWAAQQGREATPSGRPIATLQGHAGAVRGLALSADGQLLASGGVDGTVRLWAVQQGREATPSGRPIATLQGHTGVVLGVAFSGDGRLLASGGADGTVRLWAVQQGREATPSGRPLATLQGHAGGVSGVALSADGELLASGGADGTVRLWAAQQGREATPSGRSLATLQAHTGGVLGLALAGDERLLASGGFDGTVKLWAAQLGRVATPSGQLLATLQGHTGAVWGAALSADGQLLASGGVDGTVRLWEAPSGRPLATVQGHTGAVRGVALSADGQMLASGGVDGTIRLWEAGSGQLLATLQGHTGAVYGVGLSGDGRLLVSGGLDGTVRLWAAQQGREATPSGRPLATLQGHANAVPGVALSWDGRLLASGGHDGTVRLWEAQSGRPLATLQGHTGVIYGVALSWDGQLLASGGDDRTVRLWAAQQGREAMPSGRPLATLLGHTGVVRRVALSGDGRLVASAGDDGTVRLWEAGSGRPLATLQGHMGVVLGVALSRDGQLVASASFDRTVRLWEAASGRLLATLQEHTGAVWGVALSGDGRLLASGGDDGTVRLWEAGSGACLRTLRADRRYERLNITGLTGVTEAQRAAFLALGAIEQPPASSSVPARVP